MAMESARAQELLDDTKYSGNLSMGELRDLLLRAGYQPQEADKMACRRGWNRLIAGEVA